MISTEKINITSQIKANKWTVLIVLSISAILITLVILISNWKQVPISNLTRDVVTTAKLPIYTGFLSQLGIFFWIAAATLCIFSASQVVEEQKILGFKGFLYVSGILTGLLCLDDIFLLHEVVYPFIGIPEKVVYAIYGLFVIFWILKFYHVILRTNYILLLMAFFFFGLSVCLDMFPNSNLGLNLYEDGFKMTGIVSWFFYFHDNAIRALSQANDKASN